jgi:hypothetical protein
VPPELELALLLGDELLELLLPGLLVLLLLPGVVALLAFACRVAEELL